MLDWFRGKIVEFRSAATEFGRRLERHQEAFEHVQELVRGVTLIVIAGSAVYTTGLSLLAGKWLQAALYSGLGVATYALVKDFNRPKGMSGRGPRDPRAPG